VSLFYQQNINQFTRLGIWHITETEDFFLREVQLGREITHPHKRLQHLAGRFLLPALFPDFPESSIRIADTRKPYLPDEAYHFSISHCGDFAAAIVSSRSRVGIDIEIITPRVVKIKHKFLHPEELAALGATALPAIPLLTLLWSMKEAMFKWWGSGEVDFSEHLRILTIPDQPTGSVPVALIRGTTTIPLVMHYELREEMSLAWCMSA
jgi:phosphopantetheinyl transferase